MLEVIHHSLYSSLLIVDKVELTGTMGGFPKVKRWLCNLTTQNLGYFIIRKIELANVNLYTESEALASPFPKLESGP